MAGAQGKELMLYGNKIVIPAVVTNETLKNKSVIPAGRYRGNFIYNILRFMVKMFGEATASTLTAGTWFIERVSADSVIKAIALLPDNYLSPELKQVFGILQGIAEGRTSRDTLKAEGVELIMRALYQLVSKYQNDAPDRLSIGIATAGAVGNKVGFQITNKSQGCNICIDPEVSRILTALSSSDAMQAFVIENSIGIRMNNKVPGFSTSDTIMTQKDEYVPLEYIYENAKRIIKDLRRYDPSRLIMKPNTWQMNTDKDDIEVVILEITKFDPPTTTTTSTKPSSTTNITYTSVKSFSEALTTTSTSPAILNKTPITSVLTFDTSLMLAGIPLKSELKKKEEQLRFVVSRSPLSVNARTFIDDHLEDYAKFAFPSNQVTTLPENMQALLRQNLEYDMRNMSITDMGYLFGKEFASTLPDEDMPNDDWQVWSSDAYMSRYGAEYDLYRASVSIKEFKKTTIADYQLYTTNHGRVAWHVRFSKFTKVIIIHDMKDKEVTVLKVQPGAEYEFYGKFLGIKKTEQDSILRFKATCRYIELNACGNDVFIEYFIKHDVDIDSDKLEEYNKSVSMKIDHSPIVKIDDMQKISDKLDVIRCIEVNMWFNDIVLDIQKYVPYLDEIIRNEQVIQMLKFKAPTLGKAVSVNGAAAFVNGAFIPRTKKDGLYYFLLVVVCLIPDILRSGAIGTSAQKRITNIVNDMSTYIDKVSLP